MIALPGIGISMQRKWPGPAPLQRVAVQGFATGVAVANTMFRIDHAGLPLVIERPALDMTDLGDQLAVQVSAQRDVTLRDIVTAGTSLLDRGAGGGGVFIEDVCRGKLRIAGPCPICRWQPA